jgi:hypothetical protein
MHAGDAWLLALWGSVLMGSTNPPKVATSTDIPPTDHGHRRQTSDTPPENYREQEGCYATTGTTWWRAGAGAAGASAGFLKRPTHTGVVGRELGVLVFPMSRAAPGRLAGML